MPVLTFSSSILAPRKKVWDTLWTDDTYRKWTAVFTEGSYAESDWKQGSKIRFLSSNGSGMFGVIETLVPYKQMTFEHLGEIKDRFEIPTDWGSAKEGYHLADDTTGGTTLTVTLDTPASFENYFKETFPKALAMLKQIAEQG